MEEQKLIYRSEAARIIGCDVHTVTNLANRGELPVIERTRSGRRKYDIEDVRRLAPIWQAKYGDGR